MDYNEKHQVLMQQARAINASENLLFPLIDKIIGNKINSMVSEFNGGKTEFIGNVAGIAALFEIRQNLVSMQTQGNSILEKLNRESTGV